jgi:hypothetical protein
MTGYEPTLRIDLFFCNLTTICCFIKNILYTIINTLIIVTGSAGIGSWVAKRHLEMYVFDLPLYTKEGCTDFANKLCSTIGISLENGIDTKSSEEAELIAANKDGDMVGW